MSISEETQNTNLKEYMYPMSIAVIYNSHDMKALKCPSTDKWVKKWWYIHTMKYYLAIKKNEILPLATAWMDLEGIMVSEISQSEKDKYHRIPLICGI